MGENQKKILEMLASGKISVEEASRLLSALGPENEKGTGTTANREYSKSRYLSIKVEPKPGLETSENPKVNVRVPFALIRAGVKLGAMIPSQTADDINNKFRDKGINFDIRNIKEEDIAPLIEALKETEISVDTPVTTVRITAE